MTDVSRLFSHRRRYRKHGLSGHPLYMVWYNMMTRCYDPRAIRYPRYGGRGIQVCDRWHDVRNFVADLEATYQPGLSLGRLDNDKGYAPDNCAWETQQTQNNNRSNNVVIGGSTLAQLAREMGLGYHTLYSRMNRGWPLHRALRPARRYRRPGGEGEAVHA